MNRVKISYAVDLHEVPQVADTLLTEAVVWLRDVADDLSDINLQVDGIPTISEKVHSVREALSRIDQRVDDCFAITAGYHEALIPRQPQESAHSHGLPEDQVEQVGELSEKIRQLQQAMVETATNDYSDEEG